MDLGRNDPCHCGSGRKYKKCCLEKDEANAANARSAGRGTIAGGFGASAAESAFLSVASRLEAGGEEALEDSVQALAALFETDGLLGDVRYDGELFVELVEREMQRSGPLGDDVEENRERLFQAIKGRLVSKEFIRNVRERLKEVAADPQATREEREGAVIGLAAAERGGPIAQIIFEIQLQELLGASVDTRAELRNDLARRSFEVLAADSGPLVQSALTILTGDESPAILTIDEMLMVLTRVSRREPPPESPMEATEDEEEMERRIVARLADRLRPHIAELDKDRAWVERVRARVMRDALAASDDEHARRLRTIADAFALAGGLLVVAHIQNPGFLIAWRSDDEREELAMAIMADDGSPDLPEMLRACRAWFDARPAIEGVADNLARAAELLAVDEGT